MHKFLLVAVLVIAFTSCKKRGPLSARGKLLCGRWVSSDQRYNNEKFDFTPSGTLVDYEHQNANGPEMADTWQITGDQLYLKYTRAFYFRMALHGALHAYHP